MSSTFYKRRKQGRETGSQGPQEDQTRPDQAMESEPPPEPGRGLGSQRGAHVGLSTSGAVTPGRQQLLPSGGDPSSCPYAALLVGCEPSPQPQVSQRPSQGPACLSGCLPQPDRVPLHSRSFHSFRLGLLMRNLANPVLVSGFVVSSPDL